jgi:hypothetical protein
MSMRKGLPSKSHHLPAQRLEIILVVQERAHQPVLARIIPTKHADSPERAAQNQSGRTEEVQQVDITPQGRSALICQDKLLSARQPIIASHGQIDVAGGAKFAACRRPVQVAAADFRVPLENWPQ